MEGGYWQVVTSMFVHVDIIHLSVNMIFLLIFGSRSEEFFRPHVYFFIYFLSGVSRNLLTFMLVHPLTLSAGASGAIFGMFGACVIYIRKAFGQSIIRALFYSLLLIAITYSREVNLLAHFGGLASGLVSRYVLAASRESISSVEDRLT